MKTIYSIDKELLGYLDEYRQWVMSDRVQNLLTASLERRPSKFKPNDSVSEGPSDFPASLDYLKKIDHPLHIGFPIDMWGIDLNYTMLKKDPIRVEKELYDEVRQHDLRLDDNLQMALGARYCALKAFYPPQGHIGWHTNWNAPGYNIIFTYSPSGKGYWRHINPQGATELSPRAEGLVHIDDVPGWHCKVGYFGNRNELDKIVWHTAYTNEPRLTVSYLVQDKAIWENMVRDIERQ